MRQTNQQRNYVTEYYCKLSEEHLWLIFFIKSCFEILSTMPKITVRILQNQCLGYGYLFKEESTLNFIKIQVFAR